jgi:outer membrane protein assembly factor BamB
MNNKKRKTIFKNSNLLGLNLWFCVFSLSLLAYPPDQLCWAVSSKVTRHSSSTDLLKGKTEDIVIGSKGTVQLGCAAKILAENSEGVWSINSIVVNADTIFIGTSPNGNIYKYSLDKLTKIYPTDQQPHESTKPTGNEPNDANKPDDANEVRQEKHLQNEHIFAMATDVTGRLLTAVSGDTCKLMRLEKGKMQTIFEPNDVKYIFAIAIDNAGNIYLATGPQGRVYKLDPLGKNPKIVYESRDKNILSLAIDPNDFVYAGSDDRGLVYRINPKTETATVLYDSDQPEITALLFTENGDLYAAATSAKITQAQAEPPPELPLAGRPEPETEIPETTGESQRKLQIANTKNQGDEKPPQKEAPPLKLPQPTEASYIYRITKDGYVTDIFSETSVFFCLAAQQNNLLVGTGNSGRTFTIDPASEEQALIYEDQQASQITAVAVDKDVVYLGTANPAKLIKLAKTFATEGTYTSDLIDAGQPAKWGKLQIEADIPQNCKVLVASRSGNVKDINDPTFSQWSDLIEVTEPLQLQCPLGRFCQYKLVLKSEDGQKSPLIREIAVANTIPNLAPKVESVTVTRVESANKMGVFKIDYQAKDDNDDTLIYKIDFRKLGRKNWIQLKDQLEENSFEWNAKTVEDGRYEIRITANDERSNTTTTKLSVSRISDPIVVDNTGPVIKKHSIEKDKETVTLSLQISDQLSAIGKVEYTVDSNQEWIGTLPHDLVFDTTDEDFTIVIQDLQAGEHIVALKIADDIGNKTYKTFEVEIEESKK